MLQLRQSQSFGSLLASAQWQELLAVKRPGLTFELKISLSECADWETLICTFKSLLLLCSSQPNYVKIKFYSLNLLSASFETAVQFFVVINLYILY